MAKTKRKWVELDWEQPGAVRSEDIPYDETTSTKEAIIEADKWDKEGTTLSPKTEGDGISVEAIVVNELAGVDRTIPVTDELGKLEDTNVTVEDVPSGGSMLGLNIYASEPAAPVNQDNIYAYYKDPDTLTLCATNGTDKFSVELTKESDTTMLDNAINLGNKIPFIMKVDTSISAETQLGGFKLSLHANSIYDFSIDWGDGTVEQITEPIGVYHKYPTNGIYNISIVGLFPRIFFDNQGEDEKRVIDIMQWGDNVWRNMKGAFSGCENLVGEGYTDKPNLTFCRDVSSMWDDCYVFTGKISDFDYTHCEIFVKFMKKCKAYVRSLDEMTIPAALNTESMFEGMEAYNSPITGIKTDNCYAVESMFSYMTLFNQSVEHINTPIAWYLDNMFKSSDNFAQPIPNFVSQRNREFDDLFLYCTNWNHSLTHLIWANVKDAANMCYGTSFDTVNYDALLLSIVGQPHLSNVPLGVGAAQYSAGAPATARATLVADGWTIQDGGQVV